MDLQESKKELEIRTSLQEICRKTVGFEEVEIVLDIKKLPIELQKDAQSIIDNEEKVYRLGNKLMSKHGLALRLGANIVEMVDMDRLEVEEEMLLGTSAVIIESVKYLMGIVDVMLKDGDDENQSKMSVLDMSKRVFEKGHIKEITSIHQVPKNLQEICEKALEHGNGLCYYIPKEEKIMDERTLSFYLMYQFNMYSTGITDEFDKIDLALFDKDFCENFTQYCEQQTENFCSAIMSSVENWGEEHEEEKTDEIDEESKKLISPTINIKEVFDKEYKESLKKWKNKSEIISPLRENPIANTPEELVRYTYEQIILNYILKNYTSGNEIVESEVHIAHFGTQKEARRIDTILYKKGDSGEKTPFILFEFKEPNVLITDEVKNQLDNYQNLLEEKSHEADFLIISNGQEHLIREKNEQKYSRLETIASYEDLLNKKGFISRKIDEPFTPTELDFYKEGHLDSYNRFYTDESSLLDYFITEFFEDGKDNQYYDLKKYDLKKAEALVHLHYFLRYYLRSEQEIMDFELRKNNKDLTIGGVHRLTFKDAGITEHESLLDTYWRLFYYQGQTLLVSLTNWMGGKPYLFVAIGKARRLQLNLTDFLKEGDDGKYIITHDGRINPSGNRTKLKVLEYIKNDLKHIDIQGNEVVLGSFPSKKGLSLQDTEFKQCLKNILDYTILRDRIKEKK